MNKGASFALGASFLNALVGVLSLTGFAQGLAAQQVAFYKCAVAFVVLSCLVLAYKKHQEGIMALLKHSHYLAVLAFFGFFCLNYFETSAYGYNSVAMVVFVMLGASTMTTFVVSFIFSVSTIDLPKVIATLLALAGLACFAAEHTLHINGGLMLASLAGAGYGLFLVLSDRLNLEVQGIPLLWWLTLFGLFYLSIPFFTHHPRLPTLSMVPSLFILGIGPTIGGFYCTTKALSLLPATDVQLFELAEPIIAALLAFIFYKQTLTIYEVLGALLIISAIAFNMRGAFSKRKELHFE